MRAKGHGAHENEHAGRQSAGTSKASVVPSLDDNPGITPASFGISLNAIAARLTVLSTAVNPDPRTSTRVPIFPVVGASDTMATALTPLASDGNAGETQLAEIRASKATNRMVFIILRVASRRAVDVPEQGSSRPAGTIVT